MFIAGTIIPDVSVDFKKFFSSPQTNKKRKKLKSLMINLQELNSQNYHDKLSLLCVCIAFIKVYDKSSKECEKQAEN